jgi:hypothetical protein
VGLIPERRPKSFEIDVSKLEKGFFEHEYAFRDKHSNVEASNHTIVKPTIDIVESRAPALRALSSDAIPNSLPQVSVFKLIDHYISDLSGHLSYFAPSSQVGLLYDGKIHCDPKTMLDGGSNVCLADDKWCKEHGIPVLPTKLRLATSNAASTDLAGITPVLTLSYGSGDTAFRTQHAFLVVPHVPGGPFRVLIGNRDALKHGGIVDLGAHTLSFRTEWDTKGLDSPIVSYPLVSCCP